MFRRSKDKAIDNLDKAEVEIIKEFNGDGLNEVNMGLMFMELAMIMAVWPDSFIAQMVVLLLLSIPTYFVQYIWKRHITYPRLGYAKTIAKPKLFGISPVRKKMVWRNFLWELPVSLLFFIAWLMMWRISPIPGNPMRSTTDLPVLQNGMFVLVIGMWLATWGVYTRAKYLWQIAAVLLVFIALAGYYHIYPSWIVAPIGLSLFVFGLIQLRRFLLDNPLPEAPDVP